jgi:hypothetical protein
MFEKRFCIIFNISLAFVFIHESTTAKLKALNMLRYIFSLYLHLVEYLAFQKV